MRMEGLVGDENAIERNRQVDLLEREMRLTAIRAQRNELYRLIRSRKITEGILTKLVRETDLMEARLLGK